MATADLLPSSVSLFDYICTLTSYTHNELEEIIAKRAVPSQDFERLLQEVKVLPESAPPRDLVLDWRGMPYSSPLRNNCDLKMRNVLNRFITQHIRTKPSFRERNCLALGYRIKSDLSNNAGMRNTTDIECEYINTIHSLLFTPSWQKLAYFVGEAILLHLLSRPVFVPGSNGCFLQVAGTLINEIIYQQASAQSSSTQGRAFFAKRQHLNSKMKLAAERHLPLPPASEALPVQVHALTEMPHFDLFYKHSYHKVNRLSLNKITTSGSSLMADIFGNVLLEEKQGLVRVLEEKSQGNMVLCAALEDMILHVVNKYRRCDVPKALSDHLRMKEGGRNNQTPNDDGNIPRKRRRTRGCRSGRAEQKKKDRKCFLQKKLPTVMASGIDITIQQNRVTSPRSIVSPRKPSSVREVGSVGKRLMHRLHKSISQNVAFQDDGFISQQDDSDVDHTQEMMIEKDGSKDSIQMPSTHVSGIESVNNRIEDTAPERKRRKKSSDDILSYLPTQSTINSGLLHHLHRNQSTQMSSSLSTSESAHGVETAPGPRSLELKRRYSQAAEYFEMSTPTVHVSEFIKSVCRRTFSIADVWGTRRNSDTFLASVDWYIKLGRSETVTVAQFASKIEMQKLPWLLKATYPSGGRLTTTSLFYAFIYWIVSDFINPLIASYFYVTEGEGRGTEVLFYRRSVWNLILERGFQQVGGHFMSILESGRSIVSVDGVVRKYASARFMPKKASLRLITNLRTKRSLASSGPPAPAHFYQDGGYVNNSTLYNCLHVLYDMYTRNPALAGFGSMGVSEIHAKLANFVKRRDFGRESTDRPAHFYVAVLDLEKCYDNVDTVQLFNLVRDLLDNKLQGDEAGIVLGDIGSETGSCIDGVAINPSVTNSVCERSADEFGLHKYHVSHRLTSLGRSISKTVRHLTRGDDTLTFEEAAEKIASHHSKSIIADGVVVPKLSNTEILKILNAHLFNHVVRMPVYNTRKESPFSKRHDFDLFTEVKGIPQGSVLSPLLCNLYYGNAERKVFGNADEVQRLGLHRSTMILRIMDDYVVISEDKACVQHFLQRAHQSLKPYGGGVNPLKTKVNFPSVIEVDGKRVELSQIEDSFMPWCGYDIDTYTLEVRPSMARLLSRHLRFSINAECISPAQALRRALKSYVRMKCHPIVLDGVINSFSTVYRNIYEIFIVAAMRMHACITSMKHVFVLSKNNEFLALCIEEAILFVAHLAGTIIIKKGRKRLVLEREDHIEETEGAFIQGIDDTEQKAEPDEKVMARQEHLNGRTKDGCCPVSRDQIIWLGFLAFSTVLERHKALYARIYSIIRKKRAVQEAKLRKMNLYHETEVLNVCTTILDSKWL